MDLFLARRQLLIYFKSESKRAQLKLKYRSRSHTNVFYLHFECNHLHWWPSSLDFLANQTQRDLLNTEKKKLSRDGQTFGRCRNQISAALADLKAENRTQIQIQVEIRDAHPTPPHPIAIIWQL